MLQLNVAASSKARLNMCVAPAHRRRAQPTPTRRKAGWLCTLRPCCLGAAPLRPAMNSSHVAASKSGLNPSCCCSYAHAVENCTEMNTSGFCRIFFRCIVSSKFSCSGDHCSGCCRCHHRTWCYCCSCSIFKQPDLGIELGLGVIDYIHILYLLAVVFTFCSRICSVVWLSRGHVVDRLRFSQALGLKLRNLSESNPTFSLSLFRSHLSTPTFPTIDTCQWWCTEHNTKVKWNYCCKWSKLIYCPINIINCKLNVEMNYWRAHQQQKKKLPKTTSIFMVEPHICINWLLIRIIKRQQESKNCSSVYRPDELSCCCHLWRCSTWPGTYAPAIYIMWSATTSITLIIGVNNKSDNS